MKRHGFTLIELCVVVGIIAILAAILFPVFSRARVKGWQFSCHSNLKELSSAYLMYCGDTGESLLPESLLKSDFGLENAIVPYASKLIYGEPHDYFVCPADDRKSQEI